jgi:phosphohistidine phosphatase
MPGRPADRGPLRTLADMKLYLVQHGQAKPEDEDPERPLTTDGADVVGRVARRAVERLGVRPRRVVHSGKTRARQTAEIWGRLLDVDAEQSDALAPNDDPTAWVRRIADENEDLMLVGHLPHLARLATMLLTGSAADPLIQFQQGGLVTLEPSDTGWMVSVVLPPQGV